MSTVAIPAWTANGVIPPINPTAPTVERSPYTVALCDLVLRFATSQRRVQILGGFLRYRARLHAAGLRAGFQWLNGSFHENVEVVDGRPPNDLDVVTFYTLPVGVTQQQIMALAPDVFPTTAVARMAVKTTYFVDAFTVSLGSRAPLLVQQSAYWYSMWSHRRDSTWKGYLQIDLDPMDDALADVQLKASAYSGGSP